MSLWEYKVISSGKGGFATPALLEKFLNDLGRDEWEIVEFRTAPENPLAFSGLARRSTQRDWTLQDAAAAAAKAEAEKLRAEFEAKFKAATSSAGPTAEERTPSFLEEKAAPDDGFRKPVDTSHDDEPETADDEKDDWDKLTAAEEDELPTFFEAIKPHMRRNQRGPGMSVGVDYLAKKWDQSEDDIKAALAECGFVVPDDEDAKAEYLEYDGDLYWLNINRRGELWINTKEKPRQIFRAVKAQKIAVEEEPKPAERREKPEAADRKPESGEASPEGASAESKTQNVKPETSGGAAPAAPLPPGAELLTKIRPHMRRNRRGPGGSGSTSFLSRALRTKEEELKNAFVALGLTLPGHANDKPIYTEIGNELWWLNLDSRGGLWINGRERKPGETAAAAAQEESAAAPEVAPEAPAAPSIAEPSAPPAAPVALTPASDHPTPVEPAAAPPAAIATIPSDTPDTPRALEAASASVLARVRPLLKETRTGGIAAKVERLAEELGQPAEDLLAALVPAGLKVPEKPREKPVFVPHADEILWLNRNAKGELWLNAKASKFADKEEAAADEDGENTDDESADIADGAEGDGEKKARRGGRPRARKAE